MKQRSPYTTQEMDTVVSPVGWVHGIVSASVLVYDVGRRRAANCEGPRTDLASLSHTYCVLTDLFQSQIVEAL